MSGAPPAVRATGVGKRFGRQWALAHVDLQLEEGEVTMLAGANGSGKTTLLRLIAGLHQPTCGRLEVFGMNPRTERLGCRRVLSVISHDNYLYPPLTALETLRLWSRLVGRTASEPELLAMLEEVELGDRGHHYVGGFSAGMRKRLTLLRTRLERPRLVLLDEPLSALDVAGRRLVEDWIRRFRDDGRAVVLASHSVERMSRLCDRAVLLVGGQVAWVGPAGELPQQMEARS